ncbi:hypothetical protein [Streptomyces sp. YU58]|nr:hypothetical protein [Streptomyces coralus]WLW52120.1 hypothetical protein QU709_12335 [Streptomyces coralus]
MSAVGLDAMALTTEGGRCPGSLRVSAMGLGAPPLTTEGVL